MTFATRFALTLTAALAALPATALAQVSVTAGDGVCAAGEAPLSFREASRHREAICGQLGEWYIARLADGGSMDGPGYGCQIRPTDGRALGHTLCAPGRRGMPRQAVRVDASLAGTYDGVHPHWRDAVVLSPDGTYRRGNGDPGRWHVEGDTLVLAWDRWAPERLVIQPDGSFRAPSNGFTLRLRPSHAVDVVGTYQGMHPHWRDTVTLFANGRYQRGNGDPGRWFVRGNTLVLDWDHWGTAHLAVLPDGSFRGTDGFTLTPLAVPPRPRHRRHHRRVRPRFIR